MCLSPFSILFISHLTLPASLNSTPRCLSRSTLVKQLSSRKALLQLVTGLLSGLRIVQDIDNLLTYKFLVMNLRVKCQHACMLTSEHFCLPYRTTLLHCLVSKTLFTRQVHTQCMECFICVLGCNHSPV